MDHKYFQKLERKSSHLHGFFNTRFKKQARKYINIFSSSFPVNKQHKVITKITKSMCKFLWNFTRVFKQARGVISIKQCKNSTKIDWELRNKAKQAQAQSIMQKWVGLWVSPGSMGQAKPVQKEDCSLLSVKRVHLQPSFS